jgi:tetratricopeptide (TPR) repeat protein
MRGAIVLLALAAGVTAAQDRPADWTGELVVGKKYADEITFGDQVNGKQEWFEFRGIYPIAVREDRDGWLRIFDGHREGWAKKDEFVLSRDAPAYFTDRIRADPKDYFAWMQRGHGWKDRAEYDNAIKDYTEAIRLSPRSADAFNSRGLSWSQKNDEDRAIKDFDEAIRIDPKYELPFNNRGVSWRRKGDLDRAIRDYTEAIRLDPRYARAYENRAYAWRVKGNLRSAMDDYGKVAELDPNHPNAQRERGALAFRLGELSVARTAYDAALRLEPKAVLYGSRADVLYRLAEFDSAVKDFDEALRLDPKNGWAPFGRAAALFAAGKLGAAGGCRKVVEQAGPMTPYPSSSATSPLAGIRTMRPRSGSWPAPTN